MQFQLSGIGPGGRYPLVSSRSPSGARPAKPQRVRGSLSRNRGPMKGELVSRLPVGNGENLVQQIKLRYALRKSLSVLMIGCVANWVNCRVKQLRAGSCSFRAGSCMSANRLRLRSTDFRIGTNNGEARAGIDSVNCAAVCQPTRTTPAFQMQAFQTDATRTAIFRPLAQCGGPMHEPTRPGSASLVRSHQMAQVQTSQAFSQFESCNVSTLWCKAVHVFL
jgi:hypothetical protein